MDIDDTNTALKAATIFGNVGEAVHLTGHVFKHCIAPAVHSAMGPVTLAFDVGYGLWYLRNHTAIEECRERKRLLLAILREDVTDNDGFVLQNFRDLKQLMSADEIRTCLEVQRPTLSPQKVVQLVRLGLL